MHSAASLATFEHLKTRLKAHSGEKPNKCNLLCILLSNILDWPVRRREGRAMAEPRRRTSEERTARIFSLQEEMDSEWEKVDSSSVVQNQCRDWHSLWWDNEINSWWNHICQTNCPSINPYHPLIWRDKNCAETKKLQQKLIPHWLSTFITLCHIMFILCHVIDI